MGPRGAGVTQCPEQCVPLARTPRSEQACDSKDKSGSHSSTDVLGGEKFGRKAERVVGRKALK